MTLTLKSRTTRVIIFDKWVEVSLYVRQSILVNNFTFEQYVWYGRITPADVDNGAI